MSPSLSMTGAPVIPFARKSFPRSRRSASLVTQMTSVDMMSPATYPLARFFFMESPSRALREYTRKEPRRSFLSDRSCPSRTRRRRGSLARAFSLDDRGQIHAPQHRIDSIHAHVHRVAQANDA